MKSPILLHIALIFFSPSAVVFETEHCPTDAQGKIAAHNDSNKNW